MKGEIEYYGQVLAKQSGTHTQVTLKGLTLPTLGEDVPTQVQQAKHLWIIGMTNPKQTAV